MDFFGLSSRRQGGLVVVEKFFSDRERGDRPRTSEVIDERTWRGIVALIHKRIDDGSFGAGFPSQCSDGQGVTGCDGAALGMALQAEVDVEWPLDPHVMPKDGLAILDMIEFLYPNVGSPIQREFHSYLKHRHIFFDIDIGRMEFVKNINRLLARNSIAFELTAAGLVRRLLPSQMAEQLTKMDFHTRDAEADRLLSLARGKIISPSLDVRRDALEKLWDAFERLKTLEAGRDKRTSAEALLGKVASGPIYRTMLDEEARELTNAGNSLRIRHSEKSQEIIERPEQIDYLFFRMLSFIQLLLRASGRGG